MKKDYNRNTMSDIPLDASITPTTVVTSKEKTIKPKINAIGKKAQSDVKSKSSKSSNLNKNKEKESKSISELSDDLEKLNEENVKAYQSRSKRSKVAIVLLVISLMIAITILSVYLAITKLQINCSMHVHGADAVFIVDGNELSEFRAPSDLRGNTTLKLDIKLKIEESGHFDIKFKPNCYQKDVLMKNTLIYEANLHMFREAEDGYYYSKQPISGNQTIRLCGGIILDYEYRNTLNVDNFKMEFHVYLEEV